MALGDVALMQGYNLKLHKGLERLFRNTLDQVANSAYHVGHSSDLNLNKTRYFAFFTSTQGSSWGYHTPCLVVNTSADYTHRVVCWIRRQGNYLEIKIPTVSGGGEGVTVVKTMFYEFLDQFEIITQEELKDGIVYKIKNSDIRAYVAAAEETEKQARLRKQYKKILAPFKEKVAALVSNTEQLDVIEEEVLCSLVTSKHQTPTSGGQEKQ